MCCGLPKYKSSFLLLEIGCSPHMLMMAFLFEACSFPGSANVSLRTSHSGMCSCRLHEVTIIFSAATSMCSVPLAKAEESGCGSSARNSSNGSNFIAPC